MKKVTCENCGKEINIDEAFKFCFDNHNEFFCEECRDELFTPCEHCGRLEYRHNMHEVTINTGSELWCRDCTASDASFCDRCGDITDMGALYTLRISQEDYEHVCADCKDMLCYCEHCGYYVFNENYNWFHESCIWCAEGAETEEEENSIIEEYHTNKGYMDKIGDVKKGVWRGLGFELEIDNGDNKFECAAQLKDYYGDKIALESDGSLNCGFEIISAPHTVEAFYATNWGEMLNICKNNGFLSHDTNTCGLHVHLSREMFGADSEAQDRAIAKMVKFYDDFYDEIIRVARREDCQARRWAAPYGEIHSAADAREIAKKKGYCGGLDRYYAVNNTNDNTVEIRIMRGTLIEETFYACIDFILAVAKRAKNIKWTETDNAKEWLKYCKPETMDYIHGRQAFEEVAA